MGEDARGGDYVGEELELFQAAVNWKRYLARRLRPFVSGDVLEIGAGFGANIPYLHGDDLSRWISIEPDARLCDAYSRRKAEGGIPECCEILQGTLSDLPTTDTADTILYIDVLEHIPDDGQEFERAFRRLRPNGHLAILCPAHDFLFSPFDRAIGHFRRYDRQSFRGLSKHAPVRLEYLDSIGMVSSLANRLLLKQEYPTQHQIAFWDRFLVPISKVVDPLTFGCIGKSILGVWKNE